MDGERLNPYPEMRFLQNFRSHLRTHGDRLSFLELSYQSLDFFSIQIHDSISNRKTLDFGLKSSSILNDEEQFNVLFILLLYQSFSNAQGIEEPRSASFYGHSPTSMLQFALFPNPAHRSNYAGICAETP